MSHLRSCLLTLTCLLFSACGGDATPVGTVKQFLKLSNNLNTETKMFELLSASTRKRMEQSSRVASDHIGGHMGRLRPEEMFMLGLANPPSDVGEIKLQREQGKQARVKITDRKGKHTEIWELVKEQDGWRIILAKK